MKTIFLVLCLVVGYVYAGYPMVLWLLGRNREATMGPSTLPRVTLFIPVYNEERVIGDKLLNSLQLDYPREKLEIVVASDGSTDRTAGIVKAFANHGVTLHETTKRCGKNSVINEFAARACGEILIFTDANSMFDKLAVRRLIERFAVETVGCVVGDLRYVCEDTPVGKGEGLYFRYESLLKQLESKIGNVVTGNGAIYAMRKALLAPIALDVPNDFAHPMHVAAQGYQVVFEDRARAFERATQCAREEFSRRVRIVNRSFTAFMRYARDAKLMASLWGFCFVSHKLLRWFVPFMLVGVLVVNLFLLTSPVFRAALIVQGMFYVLGLVGLLVGRKIGRLATVPSYFLLINVAAFKGILQYFCGQRQAMWEAASTTR